MLLFGREYATLDSVGFCVLCIFTLSCLLAQIQYSINFTIMLEIFVIGLCATSTGDFWQKAFISSTPSSKSSSQFKAQKLSDRVGSPGQKSPGRVGSRVKGSDPVPSLILAPLPTGKGKTTQLEAMFRAYRVRSFKANSSNELRPTRIE